MRYDLAPLEAPPNPDVFCAHYHVTQEYMDHLQLDRRWAIMHLEHANTIQLKLHTYEVKSGDFLCVPPGSRLRWAESGPDCRLRLITFALPAEGRQIMAIPHVAFDQAHYVESMQRAMHRVVETQCAATAFVWQFLWDVAKPRSVIRQQSVLYEAEAFIQENLARQFTVEELRDALKTDYLPALRAFRSEHGLSIQQFIMQKRVQEACRLLTATDLSIKEVALRVGYLDLQQFNKMMRRHLGKPPTVIRDEYALNRPRWSPGEENPG